MVGWGRGRVVGLGLRVLGNTLVFHISNIARVGISNVVCDNLGAAIGKGNTVLASSGISVPLLVLTKVSLGVVISNSVLISVHSWSIISWLLVAMDWLVNHRGRVVHWSSVDNRLVDHWGGGVDRGGMDNRLVNHWGGVIDWGSVHNWLVDNRSWVVDWGWVVGSRVSIDGLVDRDVSWSMNSSAVLLSGIGVVHVLGSSMGLLSHNCGI